MPTELTFEFPLPENLGNSRSHWAAKHRAKTAYWERLDALLMLKVLPKAPPRPWAKARAIVYLRTVREMDQDNRHARLKWVWDWLQSRGYLEDDKRLDYSLSAQVVPREHSGISIMLTEAP